MRFARLYLQAYGRFTDDELGFQRSDASDLHLIFGPNEAGKSTTLDAVTDFLFGFDHRTSYDFHHDAQDLRVGAAMEFAGGELHAIRRKGRKQTLFALDPVGLHEDTRTPLPEDAIAALLAGLDRSTYRMLFGLDLDELGKGGRALAAGEGEVGQSLFQAAAGLSVLKRVGDDLRKAADDLFKARASTPALNKALSEYAIRGKEIRDKSVRSSAWEAAEQALLKAVDAHARLLSERRQAREQHTRLVRIRGNLPLLAQRRALANELEALRAVPRLPADAADRRRKAEQALRDAQSAARAAAEELQRLTTIRESIRFDSQLLASASVVEQVDRQVEACVKAREAVVAHAAALATAHTQIRELLDEIAPGLPEAELGGLLPTRTLAAGVRRLAKQRAELWSKRDSVEEQHAKVQGELAAARSALQDMPEPQGLEALLLVLDALNDYPQLEQRVREKEARVEADWADARRRAAELGVSDPDALAHMSLPARAEVTGFQAQFEATGKRRSELAGKAEQIARDLADCRLELRKLEAAGEVVTQAQVDRARHHRDRGWQLVRRVHIDGDATAADRAAGEAYEPGSGLAHAFEGAMHEADRLADLLHGDTERATRFAGYAERIQQMEQESERLGAQITRAGAEHEALVRRWQAVCAPLGLAQALPDAVLEWLQKRESFMTIYVKLAEQDGDLVTSIACRDALGRSLSQALAECGLPAIAGGESAQFALRRLKHHQERLAGLKAARDATQARIRQWEAEVQRLGSDLARVAEPIERWQAEWQGVLSALRLAPDMGGEEAEVRLDQFDRLAKAREERRRAERVGSEQAAVIAAFEHAVAELKALIGRTGDAVPPEAWVRALRGELTHARAQNERLKENQASIERQQANERESRRQEEAAGEILAVLAREANCTPDALPQVEALAARRQQAESELSRVERDLVRQNGREVPEVIEEAGAFDVDRIARELDELEERIARLDDAVRSAQEAESQARRAFDAIDGGAAVAQLQQDQAVLTAQIQSQAQRWSRAKLAAQMLQRVVQQYRERHQGPLLDRASAIFAAITCGSFAGLTTDYDDDRQILLGVRPAGERVPVAGMSKGTCDQLYLALRLATIEAHIASRGPMPVIVDDLLVQFDDRRALATLKQLRALAAGTQVLFFTHHEHLIDLALESGVAAAAQIHRLSAGP